jgi:hypothetical protein
MKILMFIFVASLFHGIKCQECFWKSKLRNLHQEHSLSENLAEKNCLIQLKYLSEDLENKSSLWAIESKFFDLLLVD